MRLAQIDDTGKFNLITGSSGHFFVFFYGPHRSIRRVVISRPRSSPMLHKFQSLVMLLEVNEFGRNNNAPFRNLII
jgi:hypothetical protein